MAFLKNMGIIGYIIGAVVILPLLLVVYNFLFINKNDAKKYVTSYIENSTEVLSLKLPKPDLLANESYSGVSKMIDTKIASKYMGRDGTQRSRMNYKIFFHDSLKKYIQITMINVNGGFWGSLYDNSFLVKINKDDLINPFYGTKEHPLLAFSARGADTPLTAVRASKETGGAVKINVDTSPDQYEYNVSMYLTYVMPKSEFKKRFEGVSLWYTPFLEIKGVKDSVPFIMIIVPLIFLIYFGVRLYKMNHPRHSS